MTMITSLYRCARCGSGEVVPYTEKGRCRVSAFHMTSREKIKRFECPACGAALRDCMTMEEKANVDLALLQQPAFRKELREFVGEYKNLEVEPYAYALDQAR